MGRKKLQKNKINVRARDLEQAEIQEMHIRKTPSIEKEESEEYYILAGEL